MSPLQLSREIIRVRLTLNLEPTLFEYAAPETQNNGRWAAGLRELTDE
jgi:hypothetical protein